MGKNRILTLMKQNLLLLAILIVAAFFRLYSLDNIPPHPSLDEASEGYNAYSILNTGKDEYGYEFPILLRAYDDYRPALYTYLVIPFVKLLGLNVFAVRLPSAILSIFTVFFVYVLARLIIKKGKSDNPRNWLSPPIIIILLFAISPWDVYISRLGHEANAFFSFFVFALTLFFSYIKYKKKWFLYLATLFFGLSFDAYQNGKIFIPIIVISLIVLYYKELIKNKKLLILNFIVGVLVILPIIFSTLKPEALIRFQGTNLFADTASLQEQSAHNLVKDKLAHNYIGQILDNRRLIYPKLFLTAYFSHFSPKWLFSNGGTEPFKVPYLGLFYPLEGVFILIGIYFAVKGHVIDRKFRTFLLVWILASIIPASITSGYPHAMRIYQLLPAMTLLSGLGVYFLITKTKGKFHLILLFVTMFFALSSIISLYRSYFINFPVQDAYQFQYGIKDSMLYVMKNEDKYNAIYVSNKSNLFQSYMFYLFFSGYNPKRYQNQGGTGSGGYAEKHRIGKYIFAPIPQSVQHNSLVISNPKEVSGISPIKKISYPTGVAAIWISEVN